MIVCADLDRHLEHSSSKGRSFDVADLVGHHVGDHLREVIVAGDLGDRTDDAAELFCDSGRIVVGEHPSGDSGRHVVPVESSGDVFVVEEVGLDELAERFTDLVFAGRDDRRMRNRQPERVAKQCRHSEPVGQPAHHRCFCTCFDIAPNALSVEEAAGDEDGGRGEQQRGGFDLHAAEVLLLRFVGGIKCVADLWAAQLRCVGWVGR